VEELQTTEREDPGSTPDEGLWFLSVMKNSRQCSTCKIRREEEDGADIKQRRCSSTGAKGAHNSE
jgi:hypothetical protein